VASAISGVVLQPARVEAEPPLLIVPDLPPPARIDDATKQTAARAYAAMMERHGANDMAGAVEAGKRLYELAPNPSTAFIRGWVLSEAKRHCEALESLLRAADLELTEGERTQVAERLPAAAKGCAPGYGWTKLEIVPADASVSIGGAAVPANRTVGVRAGRHSLAVEAEGHARLDAFIRVRAGKGRDDIYELARAPARSAEAAASAAAAAEDVPPVVSVGAQAAPDNTLSWVLVGTGGALVAAGAGFFVWALDAKSEADDYADGEQGLGYEESRDGYNAARDDAKTRSILAYTSAGIGAAAAVVGVILYDGGTSEPVGFRVRPWLERDHTGLLLSAPF